MLSIDEAIAHAREVASRKFDDRVHCISCAEEHEQLTEWLEELKAIKSDGFTDDLLNMGFTRGYNKAIDDFVHECDKYCGFYSGKNKSITREDILKIAEQLKEMTENDNR